MNADIGLFAAFGAGLLSFLSPCILPIVPGYISFMTGMTIGELSEDDRSLRRVLLPSLLFVVGFSLVFVAMGASASVLGQLLSQYRSVVERLAGVALIAFGVFMTGLIRVPWLYGEVRADLAASRRFGPAAAIVMGMSFAAGWTPCVGPILASILTLAGSSGSVSRGAILLLVYSVGLGVPFLLVALLFGRVRPLVAWVGSHALVVNRTAGGILILLGLLVFLGRLGIVSSWISGLMPSIGV